MSRPKKSKPTHSSGLYRYTKTIGYSFDGTAIKKTFYSPKSKDDAKRKAAEYTVKQQLLVNTGINYNNTSATFTEVAEAFLVSVKQTVTEVTYKSYELLTKKHLIAYFKKAYINDIKHNDVQTFFNKKSKDLKFSTLKKIKAVLNLIFKYAVINDICCKNPCISVKIKTNNKPFQKCVYTEQETNIVLQFAKRYSDVQTATAVMLMLEYGLRKEETLALSKHDVDFDNNILSINHAVTETNERVAKLSPTKNKASKRQIPISIKTVARLSELSKTVDHYLFCDELGELQLPRRWTKRHYNKFMQHLHDETGVQQLTSHELRHTRATIWVNSGKNIFAVASALGHSDLKMLQQHYAHKDIEAMRNMLDV